MNIPVAKVPEQTNQFQLCPEGTVQGRIVQIIDLGTITTTYKGKESINRTFAFRFETPTRTAVFSEEKGEQPFLITANVKFYFTKESAPNKSILHRITLGAGLKPSKDFNVFDLLDKVMLITIEHNKSENGNAYANISNYVPMPDGMPTEPRINDLKALYLDPKDFDQSVFETLGEYTQNKIMESPEWQQLQGKMPEGQSNAVHAEIPDITDEEINNIQVPS